MFWPIKPEPKVQPKLNLINLGIYGKVVKRIVFSLLILLVVVTLPSSNQGF